MSSPSAASVPDDLPRVAVTELLRVHHCETALYADFSRHTAGTRENEHDTTASELSHVVRSDSGAPQLDPRSGHMSKCDLCYDYRSTGQDPACVSACPSRALDWGPIERLRAEHGDQAGIAPLPDPSLTKPHLVIKPHRDAQSWDEGTGSIMNPKEI